MSRSRRSLKVKQEYVAKVKSSVKRNGYARQKDLADELEISLGTLSRFLNGKTVSCLNFKETCFFLQLDWQQIADFQEDSSNTESSSENLEIEIIPYQEEEERFIYAERPPIEDSCYKTLLNPGALVRIKAPRLMGKTALIKTTFSKIKHDGYITAYINLHMAEEGDFKSLEKFLKWFCISVQKTLGLANKLANHWEDNCTPKTNCKDYFEKYLLPQTNSPLVLCLDEVDRIFPYQKVATEFLGMLRAWHEQAKVIQIWKRLRLIIAHSTEVYIKLNINSSPFNIGELIELKDFNEEQFNYLAQLHKVNLTEIEVKQIMDLVNGHPHLVTQTIEYLKTNTSTSLEEILLTATTEAGIYRDHLRHLLRLIHQRSELLEAYRQVVTAAHPIRLDSFQAYKLHSMGLVHREMNAVKPSCNLYRQYFIAQIN